MSGLNLWEIYATLGVDTSQYNKDMDAAIAKAEQLNRTLNQNVGGGTNGGTGSPSTVPAGSGGSWQNTATGILMSKVIEKGAQLGWEFTKEGVNLASARQEVQNVVDTTFGSYTDALNQWAEGAKTSFGVGEVSAKQYAGLFGDMLKASGFEGEELFTMATDLTRLVGDIASYRNEDFDTAFTRMYSGMVGETEAIRRYGVNMTVANMEDFSGLEWKTASAQEQTRARYDYIMSHTTGAQGDFARTLDSSLANQRRLFDENIKGIQTTWGSGFLDIATNAMSGINEILGKGAPTLGDTFAAYDAAGAQTTAKAAETARQAGIVLDMLDKLESQGRNNADDAMWTQSLARLSELLPGLSEHIDLTNGSLNVTTEELRAQAAAWEADAIAAGEAAAQLGKIDAVTAAENQLANKQLDLAFATEKRTTAEASMLENAAALQASLQDNGTLGARVAYQYDGTVEGAQKLLKAYTDKQSMLAFLGQDLTESEKAQYQALQDSVTAYTNATTEAVNLETEIAELSTQIDTGKESLAAYVETMNSTVEATAAAVAGMDQSEAAYQAGYGNGSSYASGLADGLANMPTLDVVSGASPDIDGSHAGGLEYVPYDGYIAELHRGERVQTAAEARQERGAGANADDLRETISEAIAEGMRGIAVYMDGKQSETWLLLLLTGILLIKCGIIEVHPFRGGKSIYEVKQ